MSDTPDFTGIAVAIGRLEESVNGIKNTQSNSINFQQTVRDTFTEHDKRITRIEASAKTMKWIFGVATPLLIFAATWLSNMILVS